MPELKRLTSSLRLSAAGAAASALLLVRDKTERSAGRYPANGDIRQNIP